MISSRAVRLACLCLAVALALSSCNGGSPLGSVNRSIEAGDAAFQGYDYHEALSEYMDAQRRLSHLTAFEERAAARDNDFMQRCLNLRSLVETRIRLTHIALEAKRLKTLRARLKQQEPPVR